MREVIEHLRERVYDLSAEEDYGTDGETVVSGDGYAYAQAADALELLEKLREHPRFSLISAELKAIRDMPKFKSHDVDGLQEAYTLLLQLLKGGG